VAAAPAAGLPVQRAAAQPAQGMSGPGSWGSCIIYQLRADGRGERRTGLGLRRGYCQNNTQHLAHSLIRMQLCWSNLKCDSVTCVPTHGILANAYAVRACRRYAAVQITSGKEHTLAVVRSLLQMRHRRRAGSGEKRPQTVLFW
jgi:hypothetical protein